MTGRLAGNVVVITGAAGHLGSAGARIFHAAGAKVVLADLPSSAVHDLAAELSPDGSSATAVTGDVADENDVRETIATARERFGRLDGLWNNAAALSADWMAADGDVLGVDRHHFQRTLEVDLVGTFLYCKHAVSEMRRSGGGSIVNTSSIGALFGDDRWCAYGTSKAAIGYLTMHVATAFGSDNIRCNTVVPGGMPNPARTSRTTFGKYSLADQQLLPQPGEAADVAAAVLFLLSSESKFVTGESLRVDGGLAAHQPYTMDRRRAAPDHHLD